MTLAIALSTITFILGYLFGRHFVIIKANKVPEDATDILGDAIQATKDTFSPPHVRIISPSKVRAEKAFMEELDNI